MIRKVLSSLAPALVGLTLTPLAPPPAWAEPPSKLWTERPVAEALDPDAPVSMRAFARLAKELSPAVVNIAVRRAPQGPSLPFLPTPDGQGLGTGFIIHRDGFVLTNDHVVEGAEEITVKLSNEREYAARVIGAYPPLDVALLRIEPKEALVAAPLGNSERVEIGEWVIAIGNPFGLNHTVTAGIVSAKGRRDVTPSSEPNLARFIQTDASINPGNSGGPLINIRGEVIGINTAINPAGQGIGFAVPIDMIKTILPQLATGKVTRSYLGVVVGPVPRELATKLGRERTTGALVSAVKEKSPAARAGIAVGDLITSLDGNPIDHWEDLPWFASIAGLERAVKIGLERNGKRLEVSAALEPFPEEPVAGVGPSASDKPGRDPRGAIDKPLGLTVVPLPRDQAESVGVKPGEGVVVKGVAPKSLAAELAIAVGDVITQVNHAPIKGGVEGFQSAVGKLQRGERLTLSIRRGDRFLFKVVVL